MILIGEGIYLGLSIIVGGTPRLGGLLHTTDHLLAAIIGLLDGDHLLAALLLLVLRDLLNGGLLCVDPLLLAPLDLLVGGLLHAVLLLLVLIFLLGLREETSQRLAPLGLILLVWYLPLEEIIGHLPRKLPQFQV